MTIWLWLSFAWLGFLFLALVREDAEEAAAFVVVVVTLLAAARVVLYLFAR